MAKGEAVSTIKSALILIGAVLLFFIIVQNTQIVRVRLLVWVFDVSQIVLVFVTTVIGIMIGYLLATLQRSRSRKKTEASTKKGS